MLKFKQCLYRVVVRQALEVSEVFTTTFFKNIYCNKLFYQKTERERKRDIS